MPRDSSAACGDSCAGEVQLAVRENTEKVKTWDDTKESNVAIPGLNSL